MTENLAVGATPQIVSGAQEMTPAWFTEVLSASGALEAGEVTAVRTEPIGAGALSRAVRADLTFTADVDAPRSVVVKYATDDPGSLGVATAMGMYAREVSFYRDVAPLLTARVPACHLAAHDAATDRFTLVLEDLSTLARPGDSLRLATPEEAATLLELLVGLQAPTWDDDRLSALPWLADPTLTHGMFDSFQHGLDAFLARFEHVVRPEHVELFRRVVPQAGQWVRSWSPPTVLQHGDFRTDNVMFGAEPGAPAAILLDFQTVRLGPPGVDLAYLLGTALSTQDRREHERRLVGTYHRALVGAGVAGHDLDTCWTGYRAGALYGVMLFVGLAGQVESNPRIDQVLGEQIVRYSDMALDLESADAARLS